VLGLDTLDTATPLPVDLGVLVVFLHEGLGQLLEFLSLTLLDGGDLQAGLGLLVDELTEPGFTLDDLIRDVLLPAESGQPADELDGVDVVGDEDELLLLLFDQLGDVVDAVFEADGLLGIELLTLLLLLLHLLEPFLLLGPVLGLELLHEPEDGQHFVLVDGVFELSKSRGDFQPLEHDPFPPLEPDVQRPFNEPGQVPLGLDVTTGPEVPGLLLEQGILLLSVLLDGERSLSNLFTTLLNHFKSSINYP